MSKFEGQSNQLEQAGIEKKMELLDKKIETLEKLVDSTEDEAKKLEIMEKLEAAYEAKAKEQVKTEEGQAELKEEVQEAVKEAKKPGKLDKLKLQIGAGALAALAALGGGMAIMGGGEKAPEMTPEEKIELQEQNTQDKVAKKAAKKTLEDLNKRAKFLKDIGDVKNAEAITNSIESLDIEQFTKDFLDTYEDSKNSLREYEAYAKGIAANLNAEQKHDFQNDRRFQSVTNRVAQKTIIEAYGMDKANELLQELRDNGKGYYTLTSGI